MAVPPRRGHASRAGQQHPRRSKKRVDDCSLLLEITGVARHRPSAEGRPGELVLVN
jgi:hypothetical protein